MRRLLGTLVVAAVVAGSAGAAPGGLDPSFSGDGWVRTYEAQGLAKRFFPKGATGMALQPDGKIVAVSELQDGNSHWLFGVYRWTASGALDPSFGSGGLVVHDLPGSFETPYAVALQPDGKILVGGEAMCPRSMCFGLVRYRSDGSVDTGFGEGGLVRTMFQQCGCWIRGLAVQRDGKIVAVGERFRYGDAQDSWLLAVARYLPDGRLDRSFSRDGLLSLDPAYGNDSASAVAIQPDGKIVVAGVVTYRYRTESDFAVVRLRANGTLDRSFSRDGLATVNLAGKREDYASGLDIQRDGRILLAGASGIGVRSEDPRFAFLRLNRNGTLDRRFGKHLVRPARTAATQARSWSRATVGFSSAGGCTTMPTTTPRPGRSPAYCRAAGLTAASARAAGCAVTSARARTGSARWPSSATARSSPPARSTAIRRSLATSIAERAVARRGRRGPRARRRKCPRRARSRSSR